MTILVTGGAGYIGSHTCVELLNAGHEVAIFDNFCTSKPEVVKRIASITGKTPKVFSGDVRSEADVTHALLASGADAVIHFAGLKAVGDSVQDPLAYFETNVVGTATLLRSMQKLNVKTVVFSSSATVYGEPCFLPLTEEHPLTPESPYGRNKLIVEQLLSDLHHSDPGWSVGILRYFNPVGAHSSGHIGEDPLGTPNNLFPFIAQVAVGQRPHVQVWGKDYDTVDGTGVRDYIHVVDLAQGHLRALERLQRQRELLVVNLGTGQGHSVLQMIAAFEAASGRPVPTVFADRRPGDVGCFYADPAKAKALLGWSATRDVNAMCRDAWRWQSSNPQGYV
jgi:UDP-glucose 4-epimerase